MENTLYWIIEYAKVMCGYGFLMFVWPLVVFRKYLKNKSVTFKFSFCVTSQIVIINTVVLGLGLLHILNKWTMLILFYGTFLYSIRHSFALTKERKTKIKYLAHGSFGVKNFLLLERRKYARKLEEVIKRFLTFYKKHWVEYSLLIVTVVYGMIYFSWGVFQHHSFGFGDMYVHHSWIYALTEGKIFSAGVYPEAMHCVIYSLHTLFGIEIFSCMLYMAGIHVVILLLSVYCFMKEMFHWRFSGIFVLIVFLTIDLLCFNEVFSMSRLQWTVPQEYGLFTIYLCALHVFKYLHCTLPKIVKGKGIKNYWNDNLLIIAASLAASIAIHFYVTIMAFFVCVAVALVNFKKVFTKRRFLSLVVSVMIGAIVAIAPMGAALATGMKFQGSIGWAMEVMSGTGAVDSRAPAQKEETPSTPSAPVQEEVVQGTPGTSGTPGQNKDDVSVPVVNEEPLLDRIFDKIEQIWNKILSLAKRIKNTFVEKMTSIYKYGYVDLYKEERARWIVGFTCLTAAVCVLHFVISWLYAKRCRKKRKASRFSVEYPVLISASFIVMVVYAAPLLGLPEIIAGLRLCSTEQLLILMVMILPIDMIFSGLAKFCKTAILQFFSVVIAAGIAVGIYLTGNYHGYLYFELTRYNQAVSVANEIMAELPQYSYTIVSTTDEIYQVCQKGRHEEVLTFLKNTQNKDNYTLPTEYIFFFVEKKPIRYAQYYFFTGPDWLATKKYHKFYHNYSMQPDISHSEVSEEEADKEIMYFRQPSQAYYSLTSRTILESKMFRWCKNFEKMYPNELKVFYEDEYFVCYYVQQNTQRLYNLEQN